MSVRGGFLDINLFFLLFFFLLLLLLLFETLSLLEFRQRRICVQCVGEARGAESLDVILAEPIFVAVR